MRPIEDRRQLSKSHTPPEGILDGQGYSLIYDERPEQDRLADFTLELAQLHALYRAIDADGSVSGTASKLLDWAEEIARGLVNDWQNQNMLPVGPRRDHMLELHESRPDLWQRSLLLDAVRVQAAAPEPKQQNEVASYADYLLRQLAHTAKHQDSCQVVAFPMHFEPGAALLALRHWPHKVPAEHHKFVIATCRDTMNNFYGRRE